MKLYFREFKCYENVPLEDRDEFYQPNAYFDLSLLPTTELMDEMAVFLMDRCNTLTFKSLYIDYRTYLIVTDFIYSCYPNLKSYMDLDMDECTAHLKAYLVSRDISPTRKSNNSKGYVYHPAIYYISKIYNFLAPKDRIYFKDLECYERANVTEDMPDTYFDFTRLPSKVLADELKEFISYRGTIVSYGSLPVERRGYMLVSAFLSDTFPAFTTFKGIDESKCIRKFKAWLLKNNQALTFTRNRRDRPDGERKDNEAIYYLKKIFSYFKEDDGAFHFEDDTWLLERIDQSLITPSTKAAYSFRFDNITSELFKEEIKQIVLVRLREVKVSTARAEIAAMREFCNYLTKAFPQIKSLTEVDREVIESYLIYLYTEDGRRKNYRSELMHLKSDLHTYGKMTETPTLSRLFLPQDFNKGALSVYRFYSDTEIRTLNQAFKLLPEQYGRAIILHEILGCRISETLSLTSDCIITEEDGSKYIRILQQKVNREYVKPINADIEALINKAIAYTTALHGTREYVFVSDKDPNKPMQYSALYYHLACLINENDLRDDNGNPFTVGTHIFRHVYGKRLCDMGLDDSTIAKLLGHSGTSSVKYYRQMGSKTLATETKAIRQKKDELIKAYKGGWN